MIKSSRAVQLAVLMGQFDRSLAGSVFGDPLVGFSDVLGLPLIGFGYLRWIGVLPNRYISTKTKPCILAYGVSWRPRNVLVLVDTC